MYLFSNILHGDFFIKIVLNIQLGALNVLHGDTGTGFGGSFVEGDQVEKKAKCLCV